jgi:hypothetical protein
MEVRELQGAWIDKGSRKRWMAPFEWGAVMISKIHMDVNRNHKI